jgi:hypothetical protein
LQGFLILATGAWCYFTGWRLMRMTVACLLWQLFTPTRPLWVDLPLLILWCAAVEFAYLRCRAGADDKPKLE